MDHIPLSTSFNLSNRNIDFNNQHCNGVIILQYYSNALLQCNNSIIILQLHLCLYLHCKGPTFICVMGRQKEFFLIKCVFFLYTCISVRQFWFVWKGGLKIVE